MFDGGFTIPYVLVVLITNDDSKIYKRNVLSETCYI